MNPLLRLAKAKAKSLASATIVSSEAAVSAEDSSRPFSYYFPGAPNRNWVEVVVSQQHIDEGHLTHIGGMHVHPTANPIALALAEALGQEPESIEAYAEEYKGHDTPIFDLNPDLWQWLGSWINHDYRFCEPTSTTLKLGLY